MNTRISFLLLALASLAVAACGGGGSTDPIVGTYVLDVERSLASAPSKPTDAEMAAVRVDFGPSAYRFDVLADGSFVLTVGNTAAPFVLRGTWERTPTGVNLTTTEVNGQAAGADAGPSLPCRTEGTGLVLTADGRDLFLRRT
jgi:hypothetical protein